MIALLIAASIPVAAAFVWILETSFRWGGLTWDRRRGRLFLLAGLAVAALGSLMLTTTVSAPQGVVRQAWAAGQAALQEESLKILSFFVLIRLTKSVRTAGDGLFQAAMFGLGFGLTENGLFGMADGWQTWLMRTLVSLQGHVAYTMSWGGWVGWMMLRQNERSLNQGVVVTLIFLVVVLLHALYNWAAVLLVRWELLLGLDAAAWALAVVAFGLSRLTDRKSARSA